MSLSLTAEQIRAAAPHGNSAMSDAIAAQSEAVFAKYGIATQAHVLGLMSTILEETGGLTVFVESGNYSAERAAEIFKRLFPSAAAAEPFVRDERTFFNKVYGGRHDLGNTAAEDGFNFRGQGLLQVTGRNNFAMLAKLTGLPLLDTPAMVTQPEHALTCACALFVRYTDILHYCDAGDWQAVWALVGSGSARGPVINPQNHQNALVAARKMFASSAPAPAQAAPPASTPPTDPLARRKWVQTFLNQHGAALAVDGQFGPASEAAIADFLAKHAA